MSSLTVYCASSTRLDPAYHDLAERTGRLLAERGITLVYGGGGIGLMGTIARAVHAGGGRVHGVITRTLLGKEQGYADCDELEIVETMNERKRRMLALGEGFLMLPGGLGTWEEFFEAFTLRIVGEHVKPLGIVDARDYFTPLTAMIDHAIAEGFARPAVWELVARGTEPADVIDRMPTLGGTPVDADRVLPMGAGLPGADR